MFVSLKMFYGSMIYILVQASCCLCGRNTAVKKEEGKMLSDISDTGGGLISFLNNRKATEYFSTKFEVFGNVNYENSS